MKVPREPIFLNKRLCTYIF